MADQSITEDSIKAALADRLKAIHVEVQDMSGMDAVFLFPIRVLTSWGPGLRCRRLVRGRCREMMVL